MVTAGVIYLVIAFIASIMTPTDVLGGSDVALLEVVRTGLPDFPEWRSRRSPASRSPTRR
jgi:hypothetical protein